MITLWPSRVASSWHEWEQTLMACVGHSLQSRKRLSTCMSGLHIACVELPRFRRLPHPQVESSVSAQSTWFFNMDEHREV